MHENGGRMVEEILATASPSSVSALSSGSTPQSRGRQWLVNALDQGYYTDASQARLVQLWVLATFAYSTNEANWNVNSNWLAVGSDECNWFGIWCSSGSVTRIELGSNGLGGTLPSSELSLLAPSLRVLSLSDNGLSGRIPSGIGALGKLEQLKLDRNQLTGEVPASLGQLTGLTVLYMERNRGITGPMPDSITNLVNLKELVLYYTFINYMPTGVCKLGLDVLVLDCRMIALDCWTNCFYLCGGDTGIQC
jgi:Leucine rich repeat